MLSFFVISVCIPLAGWCLNHECVGEAKKMVDPKHDETWNETKKADRVRLNDCFRVHVVSSAQLTGGGPSTACELPNDIAVPPFGEAPGWADWTGDTTAQITASTQRSTAAPRNASSASVLTEPRPHTSVKYPSACNVTSLQNCLTCRANPIANGIAKSRPTTHSTSPRAKAVSAAVLTGIGRL
jgi:hypothetical protein